jgi:hypothetical protein
MAGTGEAKAKLGRLAAEEELNQEAEVRQEERVAGEHIEQQDLNQGMDTGTHSSTRFGVNWGSSYRASTAIEESSPTKEQIEARAHELYLQRGSLDGYHLDDWLQAEKELKQR